MDSVTNILIQRRLWMVTHREVETATDVGYRETGLVNRVEKEEKQRVNIVSTFLAFFWSPDRHFEVRVPASGNPCTCVV